MTYIVTVYNSITKKVHAFATAIHEVVDEYEGLLEEGDEMFVNEAGKSKHEDNDE